MDIRHDPLPGIHFYYEFLYIFVDFSFHENYQAR